VRLTPPSEAQSNVTIKISHKQIGVAVIPDLDRGRTRDRTMLPLYSLLDHWHNSSRSL
jgi:hypothetical protein